MSNLNQIGCRKCAEGGAWKLYSNGKKIIKAECVECGHSVYVDDPKIEKEPDLKVYDLRLFL